MRWKVPQWLAEAVIPAAYFLMAALLSPWLARFEINPDEGLNVIKASLLAQGEPLYTAVWSDQPPLFTHLLRLVWTTTGESIRSARLLVLALTCVLLWACARYARLTWGPREAVLAPLLILLAPHFQMLSVSVMIGLPALAFGALALTAAAQWHTSRRTWLAAASGALLALSLMVKLFTIVLAPVLLAGFFFGKERDGARRAAAVWLAAFVSVMLTALIVLVGPEAGAQLLLPHVNAAVDPGYRNWDGFGFPWHLRRLWLLAALAVAGAWSSLRGRHRLALYASLWAAIAFPVLLVHRPLWFHHLVLLTIPASLFGAAALVAAWDLVARRTPAAWRPLHPAAQALALLMIVALVAWQARWIRGLRVPASDQEKAALADQLRARAKPGDIMLTDMPMCAFRAGLRVAPEAAVLSEKRLRTGSITEAELRNTLRRTRPAFVLFGRFDLPLVRNELRAQYRLLYSQRRVELFERRDVASCVWPGCLDLPDGWYATARATRIARNIIEAQHADGGWAKNADRAVPPLPLAAAAACVPGHLQNCSSIDNHATTAELRFLAGVIAATGDAASRTAFERGLDYLLATQYPSGGWPQVSAAPAGTYHAAITLNDDALAHVLELLRSVAFDPAYAFAGEERKAKARLAFANGVSMLLRAQIRVGGVRTVWCAQHDPGTLAPVGARSYEPPSLSGEESAGVLKVLMSVPDPSAEVVSAVDDAVQWLRKARLTWHREATWARFYDLKSGRPIYPDREGIIRKHYGEISEERRMGYRYFTNAPQALLEIDYPRWRRDIARVHERAGRATAAPPSLTPVAAVQ